MSFAYRFFISLFINGFFGVYASSHDIYFDTHFLSQPQHVRAHLLNKEGFTEGFFSTPDHISIHYLWRARENARCTVICCSGFWPGSKEGLATLYALLPSQCNLLFFDARGHGKSEGTLWRSLFHYGVHEYKDILGAITWVHKKSAAPIIIFGVCAGAFNAMHAVAHLQKKGLLEQYGVRGLIFDSGWNSVVQIVPTSATGEWHKRTKKIMKLLPKPVRRVCEWTIIAPTAHLMHLSLPALTPLCVSGATRQCTLLPKINSVTVPVLYIHAEDDTFAAIQPVKQLARKTPQAQTWWIPDRSQHACHHLKHTQEYQRRLHCFIDEVVPRERGVTEACVI